MVMTLLLPLRYLFNLKHIIKQEHIHAMCRVMMGMA